MVCSPKILWKIENLFTVKNGEPTELYLVLMQIGGVFFIICSFGIIIYLIIKWNILIFLKLYLIIVIQLKTEENILI